MRKIKIIVPLILLLIVSMSVHAQSAAITADNGGQVEELLRLGRGTTELAEFSPDGSLIAVGGSVGVWLYEALALDTENEPTLLVPENVGDDEYATALTFSPDGSLLAVAYYRKLVLWDVASATALVTNEVDTTIRVVEFDASGEILAFNSGRTGVTFWDVLNNEALLVIEEAHAREVIAGEFSADGSVFISGASDGTVKMWDVGNASEIAALEGHTRNVTDIEFSPDGSVIATSSDDGTIRLWDAESGAELAVLDDANSSSAYNTVAFSPDGSVLVSGSDSRLLNFWDMANLPAEPVAEFAEGTSIESDTGSIDAVDFSPDGSAIVTATSGESLALRDATTGEILLEAVGHTDFVRGLDFSPDSDTLIFGVERDVYFFDTAGMMEINFNTRLSEVGGSSSQTKSLLAFAPDDSFAVTSSGFAALIHDPVTGEVLQELRMEIGGLLSAFAISPDSTLVAYVGSDGGAIFDVATGTEIATLRGHTSWVKHIEFSPDQTMLATAADDGTVRIWGVR